MARRADISRRPGESDEAFAKRIAAAAAERARKANWRSKNGQDNSVDAGQSTGQSTGQSALSQDIVPPSERIVPSYELSHEFRGTIEAKSPTLYGIPVDPKLGIVPMSGDCPVIVPSIVPAWEGGRGEGQSQQGLKTPARDCPPPSTPAREARDNRELSQDWKKELSQELSRIETNIASAVIGWLERELPVLIDRSVQRAMRQKKPVYAQEPIETTNVEEGSFGGDVASIADVIVPSIVPGTMSGQWRDNSRDNVHISVGQSRDNPPSLSRVLRAGWLLVLWKQGALSVELASRPLGAAEVLALSEVYAAAGRVALPEDAFGIYVTWLDLFAVDHMIPVREKTPRNFLRRFSEYLGAPAPPREMYSSAGFVAEWERLTGEPLAEVEFENDETT